MEEMLEPMWDKEMEFLRHCSVTWSEEINRLTKDLSLLLASD